MTSKVIRVPSKVSQVLSKVTHVPSKVGKVNKETMSLAILTWGPGLLDMGLKGLPPPATLLSPPHQIIITKSQIARLALFLPIFSQLSLSLFPGPPCCCPSNHSPTNLLPFSLGHCPISSSCKVQQFIRMKPTLLGFNFLLASKSSDFFCLTMFPITAAS